MVLIAINNTGRFRRIKLSWENRKDAEPINHYFGPFYSLASTTPW